MPKLWEIVRGKLKVLMAVARPPVALLLAVPLRVVALLQVVALNKHPLTNSSS